MQANIFQNKLCCSLHTATPNLNAGVPCWEGYHHGKTPHSWESRILSPHFQNDFEKWWAQGAQDCPWTAKHFSLLCSFAKHFSKSCWGLQTPNINRGCLVATVTGDQGCLVLQGGTDNGVSSPVAASSKLTPRRRSDLRRHILIFKMVSPHQVDGSFKSCQVLVNCQPLYLLRTLQETTSTLRQRKGWARPPPCDQVMSGSAGSRVGGSQGRSRVGGTGVSG